MSSQPEPRTPAGQAGLAAFLAEPGRALLAVDYDGVLAPIVADPTNSPPQPGAIAALGRIATLLGSVAVISGRPAQVVVDYCQFEQQGLRDLVVFGHYGRQRWDGRTASLSEPPPPPGLDDLRRELPGVIERAGVADAWVEDKIVAVAVHTRRSADPDGALAALRGPLAECAARHDLAMEPGRYVIEIRPPGFDKGATLRSFAESRGASTVCYIGDDLGDLPAFDAVETMRRNGIAGLTVASGSPEVTEVAGRADLVVDGPPGVVTLLTTLADTLMSSMHRG